MITSEAPATHRVHLQIVRNLGGSNDVRYRNSPAKLLAIPRGDYANEKVRLLARSELDSTTGIGLPMRVRNGAPCVGVGANGEAAEWTRVDTGCNSALQWVATTGKARSGGKVSVAALSRSPRHFY